MNIVKKNLFYRKTKSADNRIDLYLKEDIEDELSNPLEWFLEEIYLELEVGLVSL